MSVYTRAGDKGKTHLYGGKIISKASPRIDAIGSIDELNSAIGVILSSLKDRRLKEELLKVQNDLFGIGAALAGSKNLKLEERVGEFERLIDNLDKKLPELNSFILPGGGVSGARLHLARTIARRAERRIMELSVKEPVGSSIIVYVNRLSDLFFMFARVINYKEKKKEIQWKSR